MIAFSEVVLSLDIEVTTPMYCFPVSSGQMVTVQFQRFIRTVSLGVTDHPSLKARLLGTETSFLPRQATTFHHPLICIQSVTFNDLNLLGHINFPSCDVSAYTIYNHLQMYAGNVLNMSAILPACEVAVVSQQQYGEIEGVRDVLYIHNGLVSTEVIGFYAVCSETNTQYLISLQISARKAELRSIINPLRVSERVTTVSSDNLNVTHPHLTHDLADPVYFVVKSYSTYGELQLRNVSLSADDSFSQTDINSGLLAYKVSTGTRAFEEVIELAASSSGAASISLLLTIMYDPILSITMDTLPAVEGGVAIISEEIINVKYGVSDLIDFIILSQPKHGKVDLLDEVDLTSFTNDDIAGGSLMYVHDGSESTTDSISLVVMPTAVHNVETTIVLNISIALTNDNTPVRTTPSVITVVDGMNTFLNSKDIYYMDADVDQLLGDISIEPQEIFCGQIVRQQWSGSQYYLGPMSRFT